MPWQCELCDGAESAVYLITPLNGAPSMAVGTACAPVSLMTMLGSYLGMDFDELSKRLMQDSNGTAQEPQRVNLPTGYVYGPDGDSVLSEDDVDKGLCGFIHDDWLHCHRKAKHTGKHNRAEAFADEAAQPIEPDMPPPTAPGGES